MSNTRLREDQISEGISAGGGGYFISPDYANMSSTSKLSANGSWTVQDVGFVLITLYNQSSTAIANGLTAYINEKIVLGCNKETQNNGGVFPVSPGDVVRFQFGTGGISAISCYFIPPKYTPIN